jgi:hypothetical protein
VSEPGECRIEFGPGLGFRFVDPGSELRRRIVGRFPPAGAPGDEAGDRPLVVVAEPAPSFDDRAAEVVLCEPPLVVRRTGDLLLFELPGISSWCDPVAERAGVRVEGPGAPDLDLWSALVLPPLLAELASARGWLALHAGAVARAGRGILLPGPGGSGKSTICRNALAAGLDLLSDDLVWLRRAEGGWRLHPFPGRPDESGLGTPTARTANLSAVVFPSIADLDRSRLSPLETQDALARLLDEAGLLAGAPLAAVRFRRLVRLASRVPAYALRAGRDQSAVPALLGELLS